MVLMRCLAAASSLEFMVTLSAGVSDDIGCREVLLESTPVSELGDEKEQDDDDDLEQVRTEYSR